MRYMLLFLAALTGNAMADQYVNGYTRQDGTQVNGYMRTEPNDSRYDNYSSPGNYNPYTGQTAGGSPRSNFGGDQVMTPNVQYSEPPGSRDVTRY